MQTELPTSFDQTVDFLKSFEALEEGHFILASGRHSGHYVKKSLLIQHPHELSLMLEQRREAFERLGKLDLVLSPAMGGVPVGQQVGLLLQCRTIYAERTPDNELALKRGFVIRPGDRILLVEDVITTGGTLRELKGFIEEKGASVAGVFTVVNRSGKDEWEGLPLVSCLEVVFPTYVADEIPEALAAIPAVRPGTKKVEETKG